MRWILIESARRRRTRKGRRDFGEIDLDTADLSVAMGVDVADLLALDEAMTKLTDADAVVANVVKLHYFAGLPLISIAEILGVSARTVERCWAFAKTWLYREISGEDKSSPA